MSATTQPRSERTPAGGPLDHASPDRGGAVRGGAIMAASSVAMRMASLVAQLILGRLLLPREFGVFAVALSFTAVATALRSSLRPVLVEALVDGRPLDNLYRWVMWPALALSAVAIAASPAIAAAYDKPDLLPLLPLMFATIPLQVAPAFGMARINHAGRYASLGGLLTVGIVARQAGIIVGALAGLGVLSFVVGTVIGSVIELWAVRSRSGRYPSLFRRPERLVASERQSLSWLPVATLALLAATSGDYPIAAALTTSTVVGIYFFAYQLTAALSQPFHLAVNSVLVPTFAKLETSDEVAEGFLRTSRTITLVAAIPFGGFAVIVAPFAHLAWPNYDAAILPIILFAVFMPLRLVLPACLSILQGRGRWKDHAALMWLAGVALIVSAAIGALTDDAVRITAYTLVAHAAVTLVTTVRIAVITGTSRRRSLMAILEPWLWSLTAVGVAHRVIEIDTTSFTDAVLRGLVYCAIAVPVLVLRYRTDLRSLLAGLR